MSSSKIDSFPIKKLTIAIIALYVFFASLSVVFKGLDYAFRSKSTVPISFETLLSRLGTFGDSFGALSSLVTSLSLVGLVYTAYLQRLQMAEQFAEISKNELKEQEVRISEIRRDRLNAVSHLAQSYNAEYSSNRTFYDDEYQAFLLLTVKVQGDLINRNASQENVDQANAMLRDTVKAKATMYRRVLEAQYSALNEGARDIVTPEMEELERYPRQS